MFIDPEKNNDAKKVEEIMKEVTTIGSKIERLGILANELLEKRDTLRMKIPNILHESVPIGENDQKNTLHSLHGNKAELDFSAKTHNEILEENAWVDLDRAAKITGSRSYFLKGDLARLELALQVYSSNFLIDRGYTLIQPPLMMNKESYEGVTDLGDFETVMYGIQPDGYYLIATSEHPLTAMRMKEIIEPSELPIKLVGISQCFRREVGAHGLSDKGIWRVHQFTKIEQVIICQPDESWEMHEELLKNQEAENIVEKTSDDNEISFSQEAINNVVSDENHSNDLKEFGVDTNEPDLFSSDNQDLTSEDLLGSSKDDNEEDDLEIPAFLRRQKN